MQTSIREEIMALLYAKEEPMSRADIAAALPAREANSINRMLRDLVKRGTAVENRSGFLLAPLTQRPAVLSISKEDQ